GLEITHRTSAAVDRPEVSWRNGYRVIRRGGRMTVYPRVVASELVRRMGAYDGLIEILNGVPWLSPVWCRKPHLTFLHHVHGPMWDQIMPPPFSAMGRALEARATPPIYRRGVTLTPSEATREELIEIGFRSDRVTAIPNGVDERFTPGGTRSPTPLVLAVGRLAPVKRFELLIEAAVGARRSVPDLRMVIVGNGPQRTELEALIASHGASGWIELPGHLAAAGLVDHYRSAWIVASASLAEGWGLSMTEGAGCATPAVATNIRGHRSSVVDGQTGLLVEPAALGPAIARILTDHAVRQRLGAAAERRARTLTWDNSALGVASCFREVIRSHRCRC
ncbi:MAG: glycosyltransferase family 4 protein, partial [Actinomycetota bacterium]|nr:glycosyltransferase family 4 protein [Actinomycetota bacterium]